MDESRILKAIQETGVVGEPLEEGARLVDHWVSEASELDSRDETLAVEAGFWIELDSTTFVVGTEDRVFRRHSDGKVCVSEWKSTKHRTKYWGPEAWLESISNSHQLVTYAGGLIAGQYVDDWPPAIWHDEPKEVEVLVRAVSKSHPPELWPGPLGHYVVVPMERIQRLFTVYLQVGNAVRAMRKVKHLPWQVPGIHCVNQFKKECPFLASCKKGEVPESNLTLEGLTKGFSQGSQKVIQKLIELKKITLDNVKDVVVLSSSTLSNYQQCAERWRRESIKGEEEEAEALEIGTVLHAGLGELYRQQMEERK